MKTHKITEFNILPDRRVEKVATPSIVVNGRYEAEQDRVNDFTYPSDKLIIEVPFEDQPPKQTTACYKLEEGKFQPVNASGDKVGWPLTVPKKDDILALGEAQKVKVERVIDIREKDAVEYFFTEIELTKIWYSIILVEEI